MDQQGIYDALEKNQAWDAGMNYTVAGTAIRYVRCPESINPGPIATSYVGIAGLGTDSPFLPANHPRAGVFGYDRRTSLADIKDGTANAMMIAETASETGPWLQGGPSTVRGLDPAEQPYLGPGRQFGGLHGGGAFIALADGSVRWIKESIDPRVFEALSTIAGGETRPRDW
jgi:hypothetical protein